MTSSRLPGKVLLQAAGKPMLEHLVNRLRAVPWLQQIVHATTTNKTDDKLEEFSIKLGIGCYRGSENDVMSRVIGAAESEGADIVVEITGDCPIIEKHFTLDRKAGGPDGRLSLEPAELAELCKHSKTAWLELWLASYGRKCDTLGILNFVRSLYFVKALKAGKVIPPDATLSARPGFGLPPNHYKSVLGKRINRDESVGTPFA